MLKENEGFKVDANIGKGCRLQALVTVKKEEVKKAYKKAVKVVNKEISLPGFRKGKAPEEVVISKYSAPIDREWKEIIVNDAFHATLSLTGIYPYNKNTIDKPKIDRCSLEEGATVSIAYECYPQVPEVNLSDLTLPTLTKKAVTEEALNEILKEVQQAHAGWEEVTGRVVQEGDYVELTIDQINQDPPSSLVHKRRFEVSPVMVAWLKSLLLGQESGAVLEGVTAPEASATVEEKASYQSIPVRVTLHSIQKILLPEVDDDLAKKIGALNKEDLIAKIGSNLERDAEAKLKEEKLRLLEDLLLQKYPFEIPTSLLHKEIENRKMERVEELKRQNLNSEQIESEKENIDRWAQEMALQSLRLHFLLTQIGEKGKVVLSREELNEKLNHEILRNPYYHNLVKTNDERVQGLIRRLTTHFQNEKIREYALSQVKGP